MACELFVGPIGPYGYEWGAPSNGRPYRDCQDANFPSSWRPWQLASLIEGLRSPRSWLLGNVHLPIFGIIPTIQTNVAQADVLAAAMSDSGVNRLWARRVAPFNG